MMTTTKGVVIAERSFGDTSKYIDILTGDMGIVEVVVTGAKKLTGQTVSATQMFAYTNFCLSDYKDKFSIDSAEPIDIFYGLRTGLEKVALASYFAEVLSYAVMNEQKTENILRLLLNTLHFLANDKRDLSMLKSIFEMRLMAETGFIPALLGCENCKLYEAEKMFLLIDDGLIYCESCFEKPADKFFVEMDIPTLSAIRHIALSDFSKLYNFKVSPACQSRLSYITENYLLYHLGRNFKTLNFYKSSLNM